MKIRDVIDGQVRLGDFRIQSFAPLRSTSSDVATEPISISIYAWFENVELAGSTNLAPQSGRGRKIRRKPRPKERAMAGLAAIADGHDEYADGPVSRVATAISKASGEMSQIPVIGPFMRATELGAGAVSRVASWFGFTNVPVIDNVAPMKNEPFGGYSSAEVAAPTAKLTLDPKNELSIDSRTVGLDGTDEMALESILTRDAYFAQFNWNQTSNTNTTLFQIACSPHNLCNASLTANWINPVPVAHVSQTFQYWRGDFRFRFVVLCSQFHRGRLQIAYEPAGGVSPDETVNLTQIFDMGKSSVMDFDVPYSQGVAFLQTQRLTTNPNYTPNFIGSNAQDNGTLTVSVLNKLSAPIPDAPVTILVYVSAAPDFEFMGPTAPPDDLQWTSQAYETLEMDDAEDESPEINVVYGGETVKSLRTLMHRHCYLRSVIAGAEGYESISWMYPIAKQYNNDTRGINTAASGDNVNYVANTFEAWYAPCYAGKRGSMYWAINMNSDETAQVSITRGVKNDPITVGGYDITYTPPSDPNGFAFSSMNRKDDMGNGAAVYNTQTQTGVTALVPFISNLRFIGTQPSYQDTVGDPRIGGTRAQSFKLVAESLESTSKELDFHCACGPDYSLFFWIGAPTISIANPNPP